ATVVGAVQPPECDTVLAGLLSDADPGVRAAAAAALGRIGHWPSAPAVARLLRDPVFPVRRAAGLALRVLGSPGMLLLGRYRADADPFAADMARQVLDLPDASHGAA
ncbi:MAG TPA: HEAT repeat domain-containing protein, partial [Longimicrobium sp.]